MTDSSIVIRINPVASLERFVASLELRYQVYQELGYLRHRQTLDLDEFDWSSLHFEAVDDAGKIVGVVRLILPPWLHGNTEELKIVASWCKHINTDQQMGITPALSLPILETMRENGLAVKAQTWKTPSELSRIIVHPEYRNLGVARLLADSAAERARAVGCDAVLLECLPNHEPFFEKLGYEKMFESLRYKYLSVPERVVAMQRAITHI